MDVDDLKAVSIDIGAVRPRVFLHRKNRADEGVIRQIFIRQDYSLDRLARGKEISDAYKKILLSGKRPLIVDAGANIGASAVWFQCRFPDSLVLAVEPDDKNASIAEINCYGLNVEIIRGAVGCEDGKVCIVNPDGEPWGYKTETSNEGTIDKFSMTKLIAEKRHIGFEPFIVKIDIEGGEEDLFLRGCEWLSNVPLVIIELHDWLFPKKGTSLPFLRAIAPLDRDFVHIGENIFSIRNDF